MARTRERSAKRSTTARVLWFPIGQRLAQNLRIARKDPAGAESCEGIHGDGDELASAGLGHERTGTQAPRK